MMVGKTGERMVLRSAGESAAAMVGQMAVPKVLCLVEKMAS